MANYIFQSWNLVIMKTEVIVIRLTKQERAALEAKKTTPLLADWIKTLAFDAPDREQEESD